MSKLKDLIKTTRKANPEGSTLRQAISQARRGESVNVVPREINPVMEVPRFEPVERVASTPPARSTSRWSGAAPSSRGGGFGETESQGEGYFFQSRYGAKDRANDFLQGTLTGVAGTIGSAATTLLDAADQAARDFVQHTLTLPEGVLEEKGLDTPEMRESIQRFNETMDRENPLIQDLYHISDSAIQKGATQFERSKSGWGPLGSAALDVGRLGVEMLTDAAFGAVTGGSGLAPMVARSFGGGAAQARSEGATTQEALLSGAGQGGIDYATERLFGVALPFARLYGGGSLDDVVQRGIQSAVSRFASTEAGQRALGGGLTVAASALTEGAEEFLADWASWQLPRIYDGDVASVEETLSNSLYDFMLGSVMGGLGGVVSPSTYNYQSGTTTASANPTRQAVEMLSRGEEISGNQATRIARDPEALSLLQELTGQEINTDAPISQVRSNIQAVAAAQRGPAPIQTQTQENTQAQAGTAPAASQEARTAAQQVYDVNRMQRAASALGESGRRALNAAYDGSADAERFYGGFAAYYEAGVSGRNRESVRSEYAGELNEAQRFAAYAAGQNDAAASLQREKLAAQFAQTAGEDSGLVYDDFVREAVESGRTVSGENGSGPVYLTQETAERVNSVAKALGLRVRFVDQVDGGRSNAEIAGSEVQIEKNNPLPVQFLMGHEVTHRLQELAPEEYRAFREAAAQDEMVQTYVRRYAEGDSGLTYEQALDEAAADYAGRMLEDGALLDQFLERNQDNRTLLEKIRDAIRTLVRKLTGAEKKAAKTAEGKLSAALEAGARRAETLQERQGDGTMDTTRNSLKEDGEYGRAREETREEFRRRCLEEGYQVLAGADTRYGYRGVRSAGEAARQVQTELERLGVPCFVKEGAVLKNNGTTTVVLKSPQATTLSVGRIAIDNSITLPPKNVAGHEAFHFWKGLDGRESYTETVLENLDFTSEAFQKYQSSISRVMFQGEVDLSNQGQFDQLMEEILAYLSGDIHEGTNETLLRPMFRDFDAVRTAWETLVEENRSAQARESRKGFSVDRELDQEIRQIVKEAREGGRSEEAVQADIRALVQESYQRMAEQYGTIPTGERPAREARVPRRTAENRVVSQTVRTVLEAGATPEAAIPNIEELTARGVFSYTRYTDKQAMEDAEGVIRDKGYATALSDWTSRVRSGEVSKTNTAEGWALYNQAANSGDVKSAMTILTNMVEHQRNAAQAVQATRILKQLSPDAQLYGVERSVRNLQEELTRKYGKNAPDLKIDEELAGRFLSARTQKTRDEAMQELYRDIGRQMPSRFVDKWNAWRYLAMLGNPRTHVRNVVGNAFFAPVVATKNLTATAIEAAAARVSRGRMGRSKRLVGFGKKDRALLSAAWADFANVEEQILGSGKYSDSANANRYIQEGRVIFRNKALETARRGNSAALDLEDTWFSKPHYAYALAQYAKANGLTAAQLRNGRGLDGARAYAIREAQKATYRDTNAFSQMISGLGRYQGSNPAKKAASVVLEGILPFRKTPANILVRGVEYSPLGLLKSLTYDLAQVKRGKKEAWEAIDEIAAGLTGTGLMALGVLLAAEGLVRGSGGGDDDENQYEELMGHQAYALEVGGQSYTLDWLAPEALPFFVGVNLWEQSGAEEEAPTLSTMINAIGNVTEPLLEMSCLQSLNEVFDAVGYATSEGLGALPSALVSSATSYFTQAFPTILGQAERTSQGERMTTYTEKNAFLTQDMQYTLGSISGRVPGWDYQQIPYIDAWGRTESTGSTADRALDNFLNPAYRSAIEESPMELALQELYESTGDVGVLPSRAKRYFTVDKVRKDLTAEEYVEYATVKGQSAYEILSDLAEEVAFHQLDDQEKVAAVKTAFSYADDLGKAAVSDYELEGTSADLAALEAAGYDAADYLLLKAAGDAAGMSNLEVAVSASETDRELASQLLLLNYDKQHNAEEFTDPNRTGYEYVMNESQQTEFSARYESLFQEEMDRLLSSRRYQNADAESKKDMVSETQSEVNKKVKKQMARDLRADGVRSTPKA